ncbi:hypothetical protein E2562_031291 [Oryza meyeriana var. granulata]|uniref:Disease resistance N-terminal domain-containing protein n=1 Tax=Oryza meyeriana var. granulata TaxID=110450 RepID=A0A6G1C8J1_9ORYZ|nr:hypothetical protein E2562_031291 [Oryza meyeriana var. granulata]
MEVAMAVMGSLLPRLAELLREEYELHEGIKEQVRRFSRELETMHAAVRLVVKLSLDEQVRLWARDVTKLSHDMEDVVDTFLLQRCGSGPYHADLEKLMLLIREMGDLFFGGRGQHHQISNAIHPELECVATNKKHGTGRNTTVGRPIHDQYRKAMSTKLVGIDGPRDELIRLLSVGDQSKLKIVSIFGFGGKLLSLLRGAH